MQWEQVSPEFADLSLAADRLPHGPAQVRAHEEALRLARQHGSFAEEFVARQDIVTALYYVPDDPVMLTHIAWLRAALAPGKGLEQVERNEVLWKLKWAVDKIEKMPEVPLDAWAATVDDLAAALGEDGFHLRPAYAARAWLAVARGDDDGRDEALARWLEEPRDEQSDCFACEAREQALLAHRSDPQRALDLLAPVVAGRLSCGEEPQTCLSHDAEIRAGQGDLDGAAGSFRRSWQLVADDAAEATTAARCLRVLVRLGNTDRALDLLLPRLGWLDELHTAFDRMWFAATAAWVLGHARRVGLAPDTVDGRPTAQVEDELRALGAELAARFDDRNGTSVVGDAVGAALDDGVVAEEPTLPPTHLPSTEPRPERGAPQPTSGDEVVHLAARVQQARHELDPTLEKALRGWLRSREEVLGMLSTPAEWAAAAVLDRSSCPLLRDPEAVRARLDAAASEAIRGGDGLEATMARADLAALEVTEALAAHGPSSPEVAHARTAARALHTVIEEDGHTAEAASALRWYALTTGPDDAVELLLHAASLYGRSGGVARQALCLLDASPVAFAADPARAAAMIEEAAALAGERPALQVRILDLRARLARIEGDDEQADALYLEALASPGAVEGARMTLLFAYCDLLVQQGDYPRLEPRAADAVAVATAMREPVALAVGQRLLGLSWLETGRPVEAAELLEAAFPVIRQNVPDLVGPTGWALGNALSAVGSPAQARTAYATASAAFEAAGRLEEAGHSQVRAGTSAWDADDPEAARAHFDDAIDKTRSSGTLDALLAALRYRAGLVAGQDDVDAGLVELDAVLEEVQLVADALPDGRGDAFDAEELEPDLLRQGGHLLARAGRTDDAVARMRAARALVGGHYETVLGAEEAAMLAEADRIAEAEPLLRTALTDLRSAGLHAERVEAAGALARALDRAGRPDDAQAVWEEFGPEA
ncbi:hypothetical protein JQN72_12550 [Phycicoccus sp. CSK15P-2]|uniref:hypothetical protein n=1 Tax=Phycicoccus sp. CSK15P-2 TaxID=2807627 RepID=UPI00194FF698|nr:hypothetical protein [Phycicoccus sp. CSK15P-2]MBM6403609.1 hypothetical protein [Phycicoccus sp. CSK15P-2]MBM6405074.1 hypothetical protein [Phycicoccus sp. CSK15P-2]